MRPLKPRFTILFLFSFFLLNAQTNRLYTYQQLSRTFYAKQKDSLKKAWQCPEIYKNKATQKKYEEIWDLRTDFITSAIENQNYVYEPEVSNYIENIIDQIAKANTQLISSKPFLLVDRSSAVNAYALGNNIIIVNLGLIDFAKSREEIAFAIAHEHT
jgi:predicted Zn-dependent protease